uniref:Beta-lactamase n=1 Tax=Solibacter usitatus (strain Ellin6076) TaxID=234267 RepID=Q01WH6_SOLUE
MRFLAFPLLAVAAFGQDSKLDDYVTRLAGFGFSGVALVAKGDKILHEKGYGLADRKSGTPMTPDTIISIGSITKQFTAAAILKLEMQGKLKTTDPVVNFFPNAPVDKKAITLHQLLTHTAGLRSDYAATDYQPYARDAYMQRIFDAPLLSPPGEHFRYANAGYSMLAAIVEIASGQPYERYLHTNLFEPSGMTMTGYKLPKFPEAKIPRGYLGENDWGTIFERSWAPDGPWWELRGNGGIHSTAMDMYRWHQALESGKILSKEARTKFETGYVNEGPMKPIQVRVRLVHRAGPLRQTRGA